MKEQSSNLGAKKIDFELEFCSYKIYGDVIDGDQVLLFLHGAGRSSRLSFDAIRERLALRSIGSVAFDFIGHGNSSGELSNSSLEIRTMTALHVVENVCADKEKLSLFGASMGAYNAVKITELVPIQSLLLLVPAMYDKAAYDVHFGKDFSEIIRKESSWSRSDAWSILRDFSGGVGLITAEGDEVIPNEVINLIKMSVENNPRACHLILDGVHHDFKIREPRIENLLTDFISEILH